MNRTLALIKLFNEVFIKFDSKQIIILVLVAVIALLIGLNISKNSSNSVQAPNQNPADDGKLAKAYKEKEVSKAIHDNAKDLQKCYFEFLNKKLPITEGSMDILFKVGEDGSISSTKTTKDDFKDNNFEKCVSKKLESYYLAPPPFGINRFISYTLSFKSEESAKKEAKERAEKSKPPKMLPVR